MIRIIQGDITTLSVDPVYRDGLHGDADLLTACYRNSLALAAENGCRSIAFPCISTGVYGYPIEDAAKIAIREVQRFLHTEICHIRTSVPVFTLAAESPVCYPYSHAHY